LSCRVMYRTAGVVASRASVHHRGNAVVSVSIRVVLISAVIADPATRRVIVNARLMLLVLCPV